MIIARRAAPVVPAILLAVLALSGCGAKDAQKEATASSTMSSVLSSVSATTSAPAVKPAGDKVAAADLPAVVANRTYRGESDGKPYAEYYAPDGSVRAKSGSEPYTGSWKVVGEELCFTYPKQGSESEVDCYSVFKDGDALTWIGADGAVVKTTYVEGNPDNL